MAWTAEDRRSYAPAIQEMVRQGMLVRLAATIDAIDPPSQVGRPRVWSTLIMLGLVARGARRPRLAAAAGRPRSPPHQTVWSRLLRWRRRAVLDRALGVLVACRRLAAGRKRRPTAAIIDTQSVRTGPQRGPRGYDANKKVKGRKRVLMVDARAIRSACGWCRPTCRTATRSHALAPDLDGPSLPAAGLAGPRLRRRRSGELPRTRHGIAPRSSAPPAARASRSSRGAGRSSRPSAACSATAGCGSTTR